MNVKPWVVDDELWALIGPVLPPWPERSPGPRPVPDRLCLQGVLFVLYTGITWQQLPLELGFGSGQTCWRRLERWQDAGVFDQLHRILLSELRRTSPPSCDCSPSVMTTWSRNGPVSPTASTLSSATCCPAEPPPACRRTRPPR